MKLQVIILFLLMSTFFSAGCESRERKLALQQKEDSLNQREQQLLLREKTLEIREAELLQKESKSDSSIHVDSSGFYNPALLGDWSVTMTCTQTTCAGSAVGDVNTQEWNFSYQGNALIARVMEHNKLVRTYTGIYANNAIEMTESVQNNAIQLAVKMQVRLRTINATAMEGQREIIRENNCKIIYALELQKKV